MKILEYFFPEYLIKLEGKLRNTYQSKSYKYIQEQKLGQKEQLLQIIQLNLNIHSLYQDYLNVWIYLIYIVTRLLHNYRGRFFWILFMKSLDFLFEYLDYFDQKCFLYLLNQLNDKQTFSNNSPIKSPKNLEKYLYFLIFKISFLKPKEFLLD